MISKTEFFDEEVMKPILSDDRFNSKDLKRLSEYNKHRITGGKVNVTYKYGVGCEDECLGRLFPEDGLGLQSFRFDLRNPLAKRWYWDTDIENCHYVIALKYCKEYNLPYDNILKYIENRNEYLKLVSNNRKKAKTEFLKVLYGGNITLYHPDYQEVEGSITQEGYSFLQRVKNEMDCLMINIWNKHSQYHKLKTGKDKKLMKSKYNPQASLMSLLFQTEERKLLLLWDEFLTSKGRHLDVLIHDGGYVRKLEGEHSFPEELLREGSKYLNDKLNHTHIKLTEKDISHEWTPKVKPNYRIITDDNSAAELLFNELKDVLITCNKQLFYKHKNLWICDTEKINDILINYILTSSLYTLNKDDEAKPYSQFTKNAKNILVALMAKIKTQEHTVNIYEKFHSTTKGRLCFQDGVLDFKTKRFYTWDEIDFEYYTCVMIERPYKEYFNNPNREVINEIRDKIYGNLYGAKLTRALNALSRAIAGHCEDKNFLEYCGNRNCGKGIQFDNLKSAFEDYVEPFNLGHFLYVRNSPKKTDEPAKAFYWLIDLQFVRLAISQETPDPDTYKKVDSEMWKKVCGGGDTHVCKKNYDRSDTRVKIDTTFQIMGNNAVIYDSMDVVEQRLDFGSVVQFKTQDEIDEMRANGEDEIVINSYKIKDPTLKDKCHTDEWRNATVYLLYEYYINNAVPVLRTSYDDYDDEANMSLRKIILTKFNITRHEHTYVLAKDVDIMLRDYQKKKVNAELEALGIFKKKINTGIDRLKWGYYGIEMKV